MPLVGVGAMRHTLRTTPTASAAGRRTTTQIAAVVSVDLRARRWRVSNGLSLDGAVAPTLMFGAKATFIGGSVGLGLTWQRRDRFSG